jgi:hypothetical protein
MIFENVISFLAAAITLFGLLFLGLYKGGKNKALVRQLSRSVHFICILASGILLHWTGYMHVSASNTELPWFYKLIIGMGTTLPMFGGGYTGANSSALAKTNLIYAIAVVFVYFSALVFTVLLTIRIFFKSFANYLRFVLNSRRPQGGKSLIIVGNGGDVELLLGSLEDRQRLNTLIILDEINDNAKKDYVTRSYAVINTAADETALAKACLYRAREPVLIALSSRDERNLAAARTICASLERMDEKEKAALRFNAYIMYTSLDRAEHFQFTQAAEGRIRFFNPYEIIARRFLARYPASSLIPKDFIDTGIAKLKKPYTINHIFVGFGNANMQILKKSIVIDQFLGCDYNALVIDTAVDDNEAAFMNSTRGIFRQGQDNGEVFFPDPEEKYNIEFTEMNVLSLEFYQRVIECITSGDFSIIVIALGNDKLSTETAMEIRQWAYEHTIPEEKMRIFIKVRKHSAITSDDVINPNKSEGDILITPIGFEDKIFDFEHIINEDVDRLAKHIAENYSGGAEFGANWEKLTNHERDSNRCAALSIRVKLNLMGLDLIFDKTGTVVQKEKTLEEFARAYGLERAQKLRREKAYLEYIERNDGIIINTSMRNNLGRLEHQRWNSYYLVNGWQPMPKPEVTAQSRKNQRARKHACITTFEGLDELARLQASLKTQNLKGTEKETAYLEALQDCDTMHLDFDQMDCLLGNLKETKYRIVPRA